MRRKTSPVAEPPRSALIVGLGIAGMATAIALRRVGWSPTIVERAADRRTGGYFVGLFPPGKVAAEALGVLGNIHFRTAKQSNTWDIREHGNRHFAPGFLDQPGGPEGVLRGDIEAALWQEVEGRIDVRFSTVPVSITQERDHVRVLLKQDGEALHNEERYDLVVGADGLRSSVRQMTFGPHKRFMKAMGAMICAYQLERQLDTVKPQDGLMQCDSRRGFWVFPLSDHAPTALFTYRTKDEGRQFQQPPLDILRKVFAGQNDDDVIDQALGQLANADDYLFDAVYQVRMNRYHKGRVLVLGDAAWCPTLYSGMGATSALQGAAELGSALSANPESIEKALISWERAMKPLVRKHQLGAYFKAEFFVPSGQIRSAARRFLMNLGARRIMRRRKRHGHRGAQPVSSADPAP